MQLPDPRRKLESLLDHALTTADLTERLSLLLECERIDPEDAETQMELGKCYLALADLTNAEQSLRAAIALNDDGWARLYLGNLFYRNEDLDRAEEAFRLAREKLPELAVPVWCLGDVQEARGQPEAAERLFRRALELAPDGAGALARLGRVLLRSGRRADGAAYVWSALGHDPECSVARRAKETFGPYLRPASRGPRITSSDLH